MNVSLGTKENLTIKPGTFMDVNAQDRLSFYKVTLLKGKLSKYFNWYLALAETQMRITAPATPSLISAGGDPEQRTQLILS